MSVDAVSSSYASSTSSSSSASRTVSSELGADDFLQLLVAQMSNQDPLEPTSDTEYVSQMAQFTQLQEMQEMNKAVTSQYAASLVGKSVIASSVRDSEGNLYDMDVYGRVSGLVTIDGEQYLQVGDYTVPTSAITAVYDDADLQQDISGAAGLVGMQATAKVPTTDADGNITYSSVSGIIDGITVKDGLLYASIGGQEISLSFISQYGAPTDTEES